MMVSGDGDDHDNDEAAACKGCGMFVNVLHDAQDDGMLCTRCYNEAADAFFLRLDLATAKANKQRKRT